MDIDTKIALVKEMVRKWKKLISLYVKSRESGGLQRKDEKESTEIFHWLQKNYIVVADDMKSLGTGEYYDPLTGVHITDYDPISNLIMSVGSLSELFSMRRFKIEEFQQNLRTGRAQLNALVSFLQEKKKSLEKIDIEDYEMLKRFFERNVKETNRLKEREELTKKLLAKPKHFKTAETYFDEAKSCFVHGFFRASIIVAISALESCLKNDYLKFKGKEFDGKLYNLLNIYFSGVKRLPKQYEDFSKTYLKIRNSLTHPEKFEFSENIIISVLSIIAELINYLDRLY